MSPKTKIWPPSGGGGGAEVARTGSTLAALNAGGEPSNGQRGVIWLGTLPNLHRIDFEYNLAAHRWEGDAVLTGWQQDSWAMSLANRSIAQLTDWSKITSPIPYGKGYTFTTGSQSASAGTLNVVETRPSNGTTILGKSQGFATSGIVLFLDNIVQYTGKTNTTLTGCSLLAGSGGTVPPGVEVTQGYTGGYGFSSRPVKKAAAMWAAGFRLQERAACQMNDEVGEAHQLSVAAYWRQWDNGDGSADSDFATGGLGLGSALKLATPEDGGDGVNERTFQWVEFGWTNLAISTPTKDNLYLTAMGKMDAGATRSGQVLDWNHWTRWIGAWS